ncbi:MAG: hypothetical protein R3F61_15625 [Myxococcota bacterium]
MPGKKSCHRRTPPQRPGSQRPIHHRSPNSAGPRGDQLDVILQSLEAHDLTGLPGGYFPDGLGCARLTGRAVLEELAGD